MQPEEFELVHLKGGLKSLCLRSNRETFHPGVGPEVEARILHVEQQGLKQRSQDRDRLVIWDVGLGAAANAIAALDSLDNPSAEIEIHSFDRTLAPLWFALEHAQDLSYVQPYQEILLRLMQDGTAAVRSRVRWYLHLGDFRQTMNLPEVPAPDAIFYDPYSAASNSEMWTLEHFTCLRSKLRDEQSCLLTNYTRSTAVRTTLLLAGFYVGVGCGIGEKEQTTIAANHRSGLQQPLPKSWLQQLSRSQNANPLRAGSCRYGAISDQDLQQLAQHPQFQT